MLILPVLLLNSCSKKEGCTDPAALNYDPDAEKNVGCVYAEAFALEAHFHAHVGDETMIEGNTYTIGGVAAQLNTARFYVSNPRLVNAVGEETLTPVKYLLITPETDHYEFGDITPGDYVALRFEIGIDSATNHADPSQYELGDPLGAQFPNMHWGWSMGYIFLRIDGVADSDADGTPDDGFEMHLGEDEFLATIEIDYPITIGDGMENTFHLNADWSQLFTGVDLATDNTTHTSDNLALANIIFANLQNFIAPEE
jgi:hypothetical protein